LTTFLAFPHAVGSGVVDLGWLLGWLPAAFLALALRGATARRAACVAFLAAWLAHFGVFHWIYVVTVRYGHAPVAVGVLASAALALYPAFFFAGFGAVWARRNAGPMPLFAGAALWVVLDHARSFVATGFPWALLGYTQHQNTALLGWASVTGVYGLTFFAALGGLALAAAWRGERRRAAWALAVLVAAHGVGWILGAAGDDPEVGASVRVAVAQGNIDQGSKWSPQAAEQTLAVYEALSRRAADQGAELIVWPETAVPGSPDVSEGLRQRLESLAAETGASLVVGAVGWEGWGDDARVFDSAFVWTPTGEGPPRYDKSHLVPFGEYVPLRAVLGRWLGAVARGIAPLDVAAGAAPRSRTLVGPMTVGTPICYELLFPDLVRRFVDDGAEFLLGLTNDAWYGRTGAPHQFMAITALRSAENRVWTARAANTGVSGFIDARGRVRAASRIFERAVLVADVPRRPRPVGGSFYTRHGNLFAIGCWIAVAWHFGAARFVRRGLRRPGGNR